MKVVKAEKVVATALFALPLLCLVSLMFTLVRCAPNPTERDLEIDCTWNGAPVSANLKWTEPEDDAAATTNADAGSKSSQSGTANSKANTATINTQQALMLTGASAGAALAGGGLLVKKKLEGSSEKEIKQTTSTSSTSSTAPKYTSDSAHSYREGLEPQQGELKASTQNQTSTQSQQSNTQNPPNDGPPTTAGQQYMQKQMNSQSSQSQPPTQTQRLEQSGVQTSTSSTVAASVTITKELLMQKQMDSLTKQSANSTSTRTGGTQSKQGTASSTSTTSQNMGLLASSSSAARMAAEMWPQRQREFEQLAKQRAELAEKFSTPSYSTGLAPSLTCATGNAWESVQGLGSTISNGISNAWNAIKPCAPVILLTVILVTALYGGFAFGLLGAGMTGAGMASAGTAGMGLSLGGGAGWVGAGIILGGVGTFATYNLGIMNYPRQSSFEAEHTHIIQPQTTEIRDEKGSGVYGEDVAQELLEQSEIRKDRIIEPYQGSIAHREAQDRCIAWLKERGVTYIEDETMQVGWDEERGIYHKFKVKPDYVTDEYIIDAKTGVELDYQEEFDKVKKYMWLAKQQDKKLVYIFRHTPKEDHWWNYIIDMLVEELGENFIIEYMGG